MNHVSYITPLNIGVFSHKVPDTDPEITTPEQWTNTAIRYLDRWLLRCLADQTSRFFTWILIVDIATPPDLLEQLRVRIVKMGIVPEEGSGKGTGFRIVKTDKPYVSDMENDRYGAYAAVLGTVPDDADTIITVGVKINSAVSKMTTKMLNSRLFTEPTVIIPATDVHIALDEDDRYEYGAIIGTTEVGSSQICVHHIKDAPLYCWQWPDMGKQTVALQVFLNLTYLYFQGRLWKTDESMFAGLGNLHSNEILRLNIKQHMRMAGISGHNNQISGF